MAPQEGSLGRTASLASPDGLNLSARPQLKETTYDGTTYVAPSWEEMGSYTRDLAQQIIRSGQSFDRIVALAKGGWTWARTLADYLKMDQLSSVRIKRYGDVNQSGEPVILQPLTDSVHGEVVLLFDEVIDEGPTIRKGQELLRVMGAAEIYTAALCYKPHSVVRPDFFELETTAWVVFPHEAREFIEGEGKKWLAAGLSMDEVEDRFFEIGLHPEDIEQYFTPLRNLDIQTTLGIVTGESKYTSLL
ncbi:MAG: hypothetical protein A2186_01495 [Candidatus Levybacteria bacterium RIFOXYA1_FULL_41_10]|nr:MAG: Purine phosphoribosyltransferase [Candidatus Levybacteria bacterium GW2011_GWA1_39_32]KKR51484.1 MAG: Purine phosphoribosyltransferase [Candidatus Levybacteria bacterium GW2011_GWC1_40_19]KKR73564.1 MAG: Purine phosphoribosyltransferase [Candidatus Levybacteria bacterium GW2011_GWC2_40_7]KKR95451.1 MAG: Purine phosphoribosyltransferase [Candidatus Levybacteria bacterium GW2011_GWA2_41_15]KKS01937.1 MAG: Purine phosphoribosyltransferase [Candidatus Levybacteria bacterium GW2011_GWB1_41_2